MSWKYIKLGIVAPSIAAKKPISGTKLWHLTLDQLESHSGQIIERKFIDLTDIPPSTNLFDEGNVLYSKLRPYLNKVHVPECVGVATSELVPLRPNPQQLNRSFLSYFLRSQQFLSFATACVAGAKMPRVVMRRFWDYEIPVPHLREQTRIVELLDQADAMRKLRIQADKKADCILPPLFHHYFGDPISNDKHLDICPLDDVGEMKGGGTPSKKVSEYWNGEIPWVSPKDMKELQLSSTRDYITTKAIKDSSTSLVDPESLLFVFRSGILKHSAPVALNSVSVAMNQDMKAITMSDEFNPYYMLAWAQVAKNMILSCVKGGATVQSIETSKFKALKVLKPKRDQQDIFSDQYRRLLLTTTESAVSKGKLEDLFQLVLHRAFTGELTATWREGHMNEIVEEMTIQSKA